MTKVTKLLGGSFVAVLGIVLLAAFAGLFNFDSGTTAATPNFDRASAHVIGAADLAPASLAAAPTHYLPGDINATSRIASAAGPSNPLNALPVSLTTTLDAQIGALSQFYDVLSQPPAASLVVAKDTNYGIMFATNSADFIKEVITGSYYMKINTINVSRAPANAITAAPIVDFLNDSGASIVYSLNLPYQLHTAAGAGTIFDLVKGAGTSGIIPGSVENNAIVTAVYGFDDTVKQYSQVFPTVTNVLGANDKMTLPADQAFWFATTLDQAARGLNISSISWADTVDHYARAIEGAGGDTMQFIDQHVGLVAHQGSVLTKFLDQSTCFTGACGSLGSDLAAAVTGHGEGIIEDAVGTGASTATRTYLDFAARTAFPMGSLHVILADAALGIPADIPASPFISQAAVKGVISTTTGYLVGTVDGDVPGMSRHINFTAMGHDLSQLTSSTTSAVHSVPADQAFLVIALVALAVAFSAAMRNFDGSARNHRAASALGAG